MRWAFRKNLTFKVKAIDTSRDFQYSSYSASSLPKSAPAAVLPRDGFVDRYGATVLFRSLSRLKSTKDFDYLFECKIQQCMYIFSDDVQANMARVSSFSPRSPLTPTSPKSAPHGNKSSKHSWPISSFKNRSASGSRSNPASPQGGSSGSRKGFPSSFTRSISGNDLGVEKALSAKLKTLTEINKFIIRCKSQYQRGRAGNLDLSDNCKSLVFKLFIRNLSRDIPSSERMHTRNLWIERKYYRADDDICVEDQPNPQWMVLCPVYNLLHNVLDLCDVIGRWDDDDSELNPHPFEKYFNSEFIYTLLSRAGSRDQRERDEVLAIFLRIYQYLPEKRLDLTKALDMYLQQELVDVYFNFKDLSYQDMDRLEISGRKVNIVMELKARLLDSFNVGGIDIQDGIRSMKNVLPLFKVPMEFLCLIHMSLRTYVGELYRIHGSNIVEHAIQYLIVHWPRQDATKSILLLDILKNLVFLLCQEIYFLKRPDAEKLISDLGYDISQSDESLKQLDHEELINSILPVSISSTPQKSLNEVKVVLIKHVCRCACSGHMGLIQQAVEIMECPQVFDLVDPSLVPVVFTSLKTAFNTCRDKNVSSQIYSILECLREGNKDLYRACFQDLHPLVHVKKHRDKVHQEAWQNLLEAKEKNEQPMQAQAHSADESSSNREDSEELSSSASTSPSSNDSVILRSSESSESSDDSYDFDGLSEVSSSRWVAADGRTVGSSKLLRLPGRTLKSPSMPTVGHKFYNADSTRGDMHTKTRFSMVADTNKAPQSLNKAIKSVSHAANMENCARQRRSRAVGVKSRGPHSFRSSVEETPFPTENTATKKLSHLDQQQSKTGEKICFQGSEPMVDSPKDNDRTKTKNVVWAKVTSREGSLFPRSSMEMYNM